jgi:hypothetical protein
MNEHLLKVVFTKECSRGTKSLSGIAWIEGLEGRRPGEPFAISSTREKASAEGESGISICERYRAVAKSALTRRRKGMLS